MNTQLKKIFEHSQLMYSSAWSKYLNSIKKAGEIKRINLNKLKHVYILKFTDNQMHFIKKEAILNFVKNNNDW